MNPSLYQINTRVWRHRFGTNTQLLDVPNAYWQTLAQLGIEYVWLMGVWQTGPNVLNYALESGLQEGYSKVLPDWTEEDVIGSPYAIDRYELHRDLGKTKDLAVLKKRINKHDLKLILDFVPNHFHAETSWLTDRPDVFLEVSPPLLQLDEHTFFRSPVDADRVFAHGKDPYFAAWQDTVQVNYASASARQFMEDQLLGIAPLCDGVRCDMAMLPVPSVFRRTWEHALGMQVQNIKNFWPEVTQHIREQHPDFCFIAEVYWDMEWELQQLGFDFTYDKRLRDRLVQLDTHGLRGHLQAEQSFQAHSVRFLENHDEDRILSELDPAQAQAAAMIAYLVPGLRFFYEGQWEGRRKRLPVQLGRQPEEVDYSAASQQLADTALSQLPGFAPLNQREPAFYAYLLALLQEPALKDGMWRLLTVEQHATVLCFEWSSVQQTIRVLVNYQQESIDFSLNKEEGNWAHWLPERPSVHFPLQLAPFQWIVMEKAN